MVHWPMHLPKPIIEWFCCCIASTVYMYGQIGDHEWFKLHHKHEGTKTVCHLQYSIALLGGCSIPNCWYLNLTHVHGYKQRLKVYSTTLKVPRNIDKSNQKY